MLLTRYQRYLANKPLAQLYREFKCRVRRGQEIAAFDEAHPCVFVLSTGRAGTQTLAALLGLADNLLSYHEPWPLTYGLSKLAYQYATDETASAILQEAFRSARQQLMQLSLRCGKGYVETSPQVTFLAPVIVDLFPGARFVHLHRDPRNVVRSGMRRGWFEGHSADRTRIAPLPDTAASRDWGQFTAFEKNLWLWAETNRWILDFCSRLPAEQSLRVAAEDMFAMNELTLQEVFAFTGHVPMPSVSRVRRIVGRRMNAQSSGSFPEPPSWSGEMNSKLLEVTGTVAERLGYVV